MSKLNIIIILLVAEFVSTQKCPVLFEMAILVDASGTIRPLEFFNIKKGLIELIKGLSTENQESYLGNCLNILNDKYELNL